MIDLSKIENQTEAICLAAVKQNGYALRYVKTRQKNMSWLLLNKMDIHYDM